MKKSLLQRTAAFALSVVLALPVSVMADLVSVSAAEQVSLQTRFKTLKVNDVYKLKLKNNSLNWRITKARSKNDSVCKASNKTSYVKLHAKSEGRTSVWVTLKSDQVLTGAKSTMRLKCRVNVMPTSSGQPEDLDKVQDGNNQDSVTTNAVVKNKIGDLIIKQTNLNETGMTIRVDNVNDVLKKKYADQLKITAKMYYKDEAVQEITEIFTLDKTIKDYFVDLKNFGKFSVEAEYRKDGKTVSSSKAVQVGIAAESYNLAPISATFPALLFSLSLWDETDDCITKTEDGTPIPTIVVLERADSWNWDYLPANVYKLPLANADDFSGVTWGGPKWTEARNKMSAYIRDLYEISPNAVFNLYYTDNYVENLLMLLVANQIPESQYHVVLLSDGSGTYSYFINTYKNDTDGTLYQAMRQDWEKAKELTRVEGKYDASNLHHGSPAAYAAVAAEDANVDWWVNRARVTDTFQISNTELAQHVVDHCTEKNAAKMLAKLDQTQRADDFKNLFHFDSNLFSKDKESGKKTMLLLGTTVSTEKDFESYARMVMQYYGNDYVYYYKGHPGTPSVLYPEKQEQLKRLGITDIDSSIPAELILFYCPDIYLCGYISTTFQSVQSDEMACGMFNITKEEGLKQTYGNMIDFFTYSIDKEHPVYGSYCTQNDHSYYVLEFNQGKEHEIGIYDVQVQSFFYP